MKGTRLGRRPVLLALATAVLLALGTAGPASTQPQRPAHEPGDVLDGLLDSSQGAQSEIKLRNFKLVGHNGLGKFRDYADVWAHEDSALVGSRCGESGNGGAGVRVVDISDPSRPRVVSMLKNPKFSRAEDVVIRHVSNDWFTGELAVVGIQQCFDALDRGDRAAFTGFMLFDVTRAPNPRLLGTWRLPRSTGGEPTIGCHEIDFAKRPDGRLIAGCARNLIDQLFGAPGAHVVDITDPGRPRQLSTYSIRADVFTGVGCFRAKFAHSVRFFGHGKTMFVSYWDAGTHQVDVSNPSNPRRESVTRITPPDEEGDIHSMTLANDGRWMIINPEDFSPFDPGCKNDEGWGEAYVYERGRGGETSFLGRFATRNTNTQRTDGAYTVHNTEVARRKQFFSSWYSDGIVWWTMSDSGRGRQLGQFVPPSFEGIPPLMWGVFVHKGKNLILGSDLTTGLWILDPVGLGDF